MVDKIKMIRSGDTIVFHEPIRLSKNFSCQYFKLASKKRNVFLSTIDEKLYYIHNWQERDFDFLRA